MHVIQTSHHQGQRKVENTYFIEYYKEYYKYMTTCKYEDIAMHTNTQSRDDFLQIKASISIKYSTQRQTCTNLIPIIGIKITSEALMILFS